MAPTTAPAPAPEARPAGTPNLGFLTVLHEANGYLGGYLVTNVWGRPLEFRLSTAVQPNKVQQILYGPTLEPYLYADLIGKALYDKAGVPVQLVVTDRRPALDLRLRVDVPVVWLAAGDAAEGACVRPAGGGRGAVFSHPLYPADVPAARELLGRVEAALDLGEPFVRIREAMSEARKMGVTNR
jgi:hypothetical protein